MGSTTIFTTILARPAALNLSVAARTTTAAASVTATAPVAAVARRIAVAEVIPQPSATVRVKATAPVARLEQLRLLQPELAARISRMRVPTQGKPRAQMSVPIAPAAEVADTMLFEAPNDPAQKSYLPRYRLGQHVVSGQTRYRIGVKPMPQGGWSLELGLEKFSAPEIADAARSAQELPHLVSVQLRYRVAIGGGGGLGKEIEFQEIAPTPDGLQAILNIASLAERDQILFALTEAAGEAMLLVRRAIKVAVPVPPSGEAPAPPARLATGRLLADPAVRGAVLARRSAGFRPVLRERIDRRVAVDAFPPRPDGPALFREVTRALDLFAEPRPFFFLPSGHAYLLQGASLPSGTQAQLIAHQVSDRRADGAEVFHSYYQDAVQPHVFYYLPDSFRIARRPETPHHPLIAVSLESDDGSLEKMQASIQFAATPHVDEARLDAAAVQLKRALPARLPPGVSGVEFQPLMADKARLFLAMPQRGGAGGFTECPGALVDVRRGVHHQITLPLAEFRTVFDAMHGDGTSHLFNGEVVINLGTGRDEHVPFLARLSELNGELFDYDEQTEPDTGAVRASLRNGIESPLKVTTLAAVLRRGDAEVKARLEFGTTGLPVELKPGEELRCRVLPELPLAGEGAADAVFDLSGVGVLPDRERVWSAVLDPSVPAEYLRTIKVKTFPEVFEPRADRPADSTKAIVLDFESGESIELNRDLLEADVELRMPLGDFVLGKATTGEYRYRVTTIRLGGQSRDADWRVDSTARLFPEVG